MNIKIVYGIYTFVALIVLTISVRLATGKYDTGYFLFLAWLLITVFLPIVIFYLQPQLFSKANTDSIFGYFTVLFLCCFIAQPLFWVFGRIGYIQFYTYSLLILIPVILLLLAPVIKNSKLQKISDRNLKITDAKSSTRYKKELKILQKPKAKWKSEVNVNNIAMDMISENKVGAALDLLISENMNEPSQKEFILLKQQWIDFEKSKNLGMLDDVSARIAMAKIVNGVLSILNE